jgi:hypothetical protein
VAVFEFHSKLCVCEGLDNVAFNLNCFFFRHSEIAFPCRETDLCIELRNTICGSVRPIVGCETMSCSSRRSEAWRSPNSGENRPVNSRRIPDCSTVPTKRSRQLSAER